MLFTYVAIDNTNAEREGTVEASSIDTAITAVQKRGYTIMSIDPVADKKNLLILTENGFGKRTDLKYYKIQKRGGSGIKTAKITQKTGEIVVSRALESNLEDLIAISQKGQVIRTKLKDISVLGRATQGVRIMRLDKGDKVASVACI